MTKEALKLALDALETSMYPQQKQLQAITAIKEALNGCQCPECQVVLHTSDCDVHNEPAYPKGQCNCEAQPEPWEKFCDSNCAWTDHHPDCKLAQPEQDLWAGATIDERWYITRQPEQEPCCYGGIAHDCHAGKGCRIAERIKVTQKPPQRKPLSYEDLIECERLASIRHRVHMGSIRGQQLSPADEFLWHYARAIEAAHGIKGEQ